MKLESFRILMDRLRDRLEDSDKVIVFFQTGCFVGWPEPYTIKALTQIYMQANEYFLIIRKAEKDPSYEPLSDEKKDIIGGFRIRGEVAVFEYRWLNCTQIRSVSDAADCPTSNLVDNWTRYDSEIIANIREQIPNHRVILAVGEDSWKSDDRFEVSKRLGDRVIITMRERDANSWKEITAIVENLPDNERVKCIIVCWNDRTQGPAEVFSVDEFISRRRTRSAKYDISY
jgi:hypothetical protein